jgi:hypothetical protein
MTLVRPFSIAAGSIQAVAPDVLAAFGGNMLGELQKKPLYREDLGIAFEELGFEPTAFGSGGRRPGCGSFDGYHFSVSLDSRCQN